MRYIVACHVWTHDDQLDSVLAAGRVADQAQVTFELVYACAGRFHDRGNPRVVWLGIGAGKPELATLAGAVTDELRRRDLEFDGRPFAPHLTLARVRKEASGPEGRSVASAVAELVVPRLRTPVDRSAVVESVLAAPR